MARLVVAHLLVERIVWISVRHDGELKVRSSLYIAKPCRYQEICLSSGVDILLTALHFFFTSFARYDPLRGRTSDPLILCPAKLVCR